jgi:HEPN domain
MATRIDLAKRLLQRADDDEAAAKAMLPIESVTDVIVGMLAQQAVEKSLKAVLSFSAVNWGGKSGTDSSRPHSCCLIVCVLGLEIGGVDALVP